MYACEPIDEKRWTSSKRTCNLNVKVLIIEKHAYDIIRCTEWSRKHRKHSCTFCITFMFSRHNYRCRNLRHAYVEIDIICNSGISTIVFSDQSMPGFKMHDYSERPLEPRQKNVNFVTSENTIKLNYYGGRFDFDGLFHSPNKRRSCLTYWFDVVICLGSKAVAVDSMRRLLDSS